MAFVPLVAVAALAAACFGLLGMVTPVALAWEASTMPARAAGTLYGNELLPAVTAVHGSIALPVVPLFKRYRCNGFQNPLEPALTSHDQKIT